jgi:chromosome segregation ATPase
MTEASDIPSRVDRAENDIIDIKLAISALISTTEVHQRNIETMNRNIEGMFQIMTQSLQRMEVMESNIQEIQTEIRDIKTEIRGLQTENRRMLDILQQRNSDDT